VFGNCVACVRFSERSSSLRFESLIELEHSPMHMLDFPIAEHATLIEAAKWLCYRGLWLKDAGQPHTKEAAMAKYLAPKAAVDGAGPARAIPRPGVMEY